MPILLDPMAPVPCHQAAGWLAVFTEKVIDHVAQQSAWVL
jgi:hypothetical protein